MLKINNLYKGCFSLVVTVMVFALISGINVAAGTIEAFASENPPVIQMGILSPMTDANKARQDGSGCLPGIFGGLTPILLSDDELTAMIENVPHQNPLDAGSEITLPYRQLTEAELTEWIDEYNGMGGATAFELAVVREINRVRVQHGLNPLALDPSLMMASRLKTQEFGDLRYFNHNSPVHGSVTEAADMFGFDGGHVSETITRSGSNGSPKFRVNAESIVGGMLASTKGHKEILLNPDAYSVGFGAFFSPDSTGPNGNMSHMFYYTAQFGFVD